MGTSLEQFLAEQTNVPQERVAEIQAEARAFGDRYRLTLTELRKARSLTQVTVAENGDIAQSEVSRLEKRSDAYVATLRRYVEALGGELRLVANFPGGEEVEILGIGELEQLDGYDEPNVSRLDMERYKAVLAERAAAGLERRNCRETP